MTHRVLTRAQLYNLIPVAGIVAIALLYGSTLQTDINGLTNDTMVDVGELQLTLSTWGTAHPTGYPLYTIVGNLMADAGRLLGIAPAAVTSALSYFAVLVACVLLYVFIRKATGNAIAAATAIVLLVLSPTLWLNSVVTEVETLNLMLVTLAVYVAWRTQQGDRVSPVVVALLIGLMLSHHRTSFGIIPAFVVLLWEPVRSWVAEWRRPESRGVMRSATPALLALFAPFTLYLYVPLRYIQKASWLYDTWRYGLSQPPKLTLSWLVNFELGREYAPFYDMPHTLAHAVAQFFDVTNMWARELGVLCLVAGVLGLFVALFGKQRRLAVALLLVLLGYTGFGYFYHIQDIGSLITPSFMVLVFGTALLMAWVSERVTRLLPRPRPAATSSLAALAMAAILVVAPISHLPARYEDVRKVTKDPGGRQVISAAQRIPVACPTVLSLWGIDYFSYYYARLATHEMPCLNILPLHTDIRQNWQQGQRVFVVSHFFYQTPVDQLEQRFGRLYLRSAGYGNVELASKPATAPDQDIAGPAVDMGGVITLLGDHLQRSPDGKTLYLTLYWKAGGAQRQDYSVFVHVSDKSAIAGPADILSQSDSVHPVYGWYPTSRWVAGEVVRDDYAITEDPARPAQLISVGLYQSAGGTFTNLGSRDIVVAGQ